MISSEAPTAHDTGPTGREMPLPLSDRTRSAILASRQTIVVKQRPYGLPGDFLILGSIDRQRTWVLVSVSKLSLEFVARTMYRSAGASDPESFMRSWQAEHDGQWEPHRAVHVHTLEEVVD